MPIGKRATSGFTLLELLLVLALMAVLAGLVTPALTKSIDHAREATLKEDLSVMRRAIDAYYADRGEYPPDLDSLVQRRYLRRIPVDPATDRTDTWRLVAEDEGPKRGIIDIHSGAEGNASDGSLYKDW